MAKDEEEMDVASGMIEMSLFQ
ncbi:hypothetical protein A2U01_0057681, partial [Trifolium medium]|nr:hypothetical protein [Trifolium medium]